MLVFLLLIFEVTNYLDNCYRNCFRNCYVVDGNFSCDFCYNNYFRLGFKKIDDLDIYAYYRYIKNNILEKEEFVFNEMTIIVSSEKSMENYSIEVSTFNNTLVNFCLLDHYPRNNAIIISISFGLFIFIFMLFS